MSTFDWCSHRLSAHCMSSSLIWERDVLELAGRYVATVPSRTSAFVPFGRTGFGKDRHPSKSTQLFSRLFPQCATAPMHSCGTTRIHIPLTWPWQPSCGRGHPQCRPSSCKSSSALHPPQIIGHSAAPFEHPSGSPCSQYSSRPVEGRPKHCIHLFQAQASSFIPAANTSN